MGEKERVVDFESYIKFLIRLQFDMKIGSLLPNIAFSDAAPSQSQKYKFLCQNGPKLKGHKKLTKLQNFLGVKEGVTDF